MSHTGRSTANRRTLRQVHLWLTNSDYAFIQVLARSRDESVSRLFRRLIKSWRKKSLETRRRTDVVPIVASKSASRHARMRIGRMTGSIILATNDCLALRFI